MQTMEIVRRVVRKGVGISACMMVVTSSIGMAFAETHLDTLRRNFANLRFGQFVHFNMCTFTGGNSAPANSDPALWNPTELNPVQWVSTAKSAGIKFMVLTAKHHDGFAIWDTKTTNVGANYNPYSIMNSRVPAALHKDVVKLFVQACRDSGIVPCLYFSVMDRTYGGQLNINTADVLNASGVVNGRVSRSALIFNFTQIRELLTNYGEIPFFVDDGWSWTMGHTLVPYQEFQDTLRKYSPTTLFCEHVGVQYPWHQDIIYYENSKGVWPSSKNRYASWLSQKLGANWFWQPSDEGSSPSMTAAAFVTNYLTRCDSIWVNVAPDLVPNRQGLMQPENVTWFKQVGQLWKPSATRPNLPEQGPHMDWVITPVNATATSNASNAHLAIDGISDGGFADHYEEYFWTSSGSLPQSLTIDLGALYYNVEMCTYLPVQIAREDATGRDSSGSITGYTISYSADGTTFNPVTLTIGYNGTWAADITMKQALFNPVAARYMRLEIKSVINGNIATIHELDFGGYTLRPSLSPTSIEHPERIDYMPGLAANDERTYLGAYLNGESVLTGNPKTFVGPVTYFSIDGKKLYRRTNSMLPMSQGTFPSKAYVARVRGYLTK